MKSTLTITFNETQLLEIFDSMTIAECKRAVWFLQKRIRLDEEEKQAKRQSLGIRRWDDEFLNMHIDQFELQTRTNLLLKRNKLNTVREITEFGIETLIELKGFGQASIMDIKRMIFNNPY